MPTSTAGRTPSKTAEPRESGAIAEELRRSILSGEIARGEMLEPITRLMKRFGVSRPTLRNALRTLEGERLVRVSRGSRRGIEVLEPSLTAAGDVAAQALQASGATLGDLYDALLMFEPSAVRVLAQRKDVRDITELRSFLRRLEADAEREQAAPVGADLARFHGLVVRLTGNKVLALVSTLVADVLGRHQGASAARDAISLPPGEKVQTSGLRSIRKLISLIEAGDADGAEQHWRKHLENSNAFWLERQDRFEPIDIFQG